MKEHQYFPVPLAHLTSPFVVPAQDIEPKDDPSPRPVLPQLLTDEEERRKKEPFGILDFAEPPEAYGVDQVTVLPRDPFVLFTHWEVTPEGLAAARARLGEEGVLVLRLTAAHGPIIDEPLAREVGRGYLPAPFPGAAIIPVIGLRAADGAFEPIASAPVIRVPWSEPEEAAVEWLEVAHARTRGSLREPPQITRRGAAEPTPQGLADLHGLWPSAPRPADASPAPEAPAPMLLPTSPTRSGRSEP